MLGIIYSILAGLSMAIQGVFNTRVNEKIGNWETNVIVQSSGLVLTLIIMLFYGKGDFKALKDVNKLYLLGGAIGVLIIYTVMQGIGSLGPTYATSIILVSQIIGASLIDKFGLFGTERLPFGFKEVLGIAVIIVGILIFKWKI